MKKLLLLLICIFTITTSASALKMTPQSQIIPSWIGTHAFYAQQQLGIPTQITSNANGEKTLFWAEEDDSSLRPEKWEFNSDNFLKDNVKYFKGSCIIFLNTDSNNIIKNGFMIGYKCPLNTKECSKYINNLYKN